MRSSTTTKKWEECPAVSPSAVTSVRPSVTPRSRTWGQPGLNLHGIIEGIIRITSWKDSTVSWPTLTGLALFLIFRWRIWTFTIRIIGRSGWIPTKPLPPNPNPSHHKRFMFEHKWLLQEDYIANIKQLWNSVPEESSLMAKSLHEWAQTRVGVLSRDIKRAGLSLNRALNNVEKPYNKDEINRREIHLKKLLL